MGDKVLVKRKGKYVEIDRYIYERNRAHNSAKRLQSRKARVVERILEMFQGDVDKATAFIRDTEVPQAHLTVQECLQRGRFRVLDRYLTHRK